MTDGELSMNARRTRPGTRSCRPAVLTFLCLMVGAPAFAEEARPVDDGASTGYELALHGTVASELGQALRLFGVAYTVDGLSTLRPTQGLVLEARITVPRRRGSGRDTVSRAESTTGPGGRFSISVPIPERSLASPRLELTIHRRGQPGRTFDYSLQTQLPHRIDLLTDRQRYQPGEKVRLWARVTDVRDRAPLASASVRLTLHDAAGRPVAERTVSTSAAGAVSAEIDLPDSAQNGSWQVRANVIDGGMAPQVNRHVEVTRRTVERLQASITLDQDMVRPGGELTGRVTVRTPSGSPVRGARVEIHIRGASEPIVRQTNADGVALFRGQAPAFLSGEMSFDQVEARVLHAAHGSIRARASYLMARVQWQVELTPAAGAVVPEVDSEVYLSVSDPRGRPIREGTPVVVRGAGISGGEATASTDEHGLAMVELDLPRGAASRRDSGACAGQVATSLEVEVQSRPPVTARLCVRVASEAQVMIRASRPAIEPGGEVEVELQRRPAIARRPVLVEALWGGRAVAWAWVEGNRSRSTIRLPSDVQGVVHLRARPVLPSDRRRPLDEPGATALGVGTEVALLVRPADAYSLAVEPEQDLWRVRQDATVRLTASRAPQRGWAALLVRDQAAHGGEVNWDLHWIRQELRQAAAASDVDANERFLRTSLSGVVSPDSEQIEPPPLIVPPWQQGRGGSYSPHQAINLGVLRDPVARREELHRRGLAPVMRVLEQAVARLGTNEESRRGIVRRTGRRVDFDSEVITNLISSHHISSDSVRTLGGELMTVAMVEGADGSFSFDSVASRVARARLVGLMQGLQRLADPDNPNAARATAGIPPERWLSTMVQLGMIQPQNLIDPWGRSYVFRRTTGGRNPVVVVSERALNYELVSPGPDGVLGNGDDLRDPFERAVDQGTPYAVSSGEDALMEALSRIAPGPRVLQAMVRAYRRLGLAAREEQRRGPVEAAASEDDAPMGGADFDMEEAENERDGRFEARARRAAPAGMAMADEAMAEGPAEPEPELAPASPAPRPQPALAQPTSRVTAMAATIREDFPATLFFLGETALDAEGRAEVTVPLADALTTYRLEAISWTASGWVTSAMGRIRVDQEAMVDAPVPPFATVGDLIRLPVRVANRTADTISARVEISAGGDLMIGEIEPRQIEVPPGEAVEELVEVRLGTIGSGTLVISAVRADSGTPLDAVRRPVEVLEDARLARESRELLLESGERVRVVVPAEASYRGPGELRLAVGTALFGDPAVWAPTHGRGDSLWAGWALTIAGSSLPEELLSNILRYLPDSEHGGWRWSPLESAHVLSILWRDERMSDETASICLREISQMLPAESSFDELAPTDESFASLLLALGPAIADSRHRPELTEDFDLLVDRLRRMVSSQAARANEAPVVWARAAAALAMAERGAGSERSREMLRRASRHLIEVGDEAWLEPTSTDGTALPRVEPTALMALARLSLGQDRNSALSLLRSLIRVARGASRWPARSRAIAAAAASMLASGPPSDQVQVLLDGEPMELQREEGVITVELADIGRPGTHVIEVRMGAGEVALAWLDLRYGLPWSVRPGREASVDIEWTGESGARDGRAGLLLSIHNRGARILTRPVVEIELPAGVELDEPTRERLSGLLAEPATLEGRTLGLRLRPLAPGGYVRIPLPLRWSLGGTLVGLGTTVWDDTGPTSLDDLPIRILPSRGVEIADRGEVPEQPDAEASPLPTLPPPPPIICPLDPLGLEVPR